MKNLLKMPHLSSMVWNGKDQLTAASPDGISKYIYGYDAQGNRTGKVAIKGNVTEIRCYLNGYEVYRKYTGNTLDYERKTLNISDDEKVFVRIEQKTGESEVVRYQYDNHLGSACLELDNTGAIISYEEYHPFGTTSYRSGKSETEVSLKRYKYCGKERDEGTGLYYYGMRYYAAWLCRFVSVDPLQFKYPELTPYQYASNRCISGIDLDGAEFVSTVDDFNKVSKLDLTIAVDSTIINNYGLDNLQVELSKQYSQLISNTIEGGTGNIHIIPISKADWNTPSHTGQENSGGSVGGATWGLNSNVMPLYDSENKLKPLDEVSNVILHESMHVYLGAHPFEQAYGEDDMMYHTGGANFESIPDVTNPRIKENLMMYSYMSIDGIKISDYLKDNGLIPLHLTQGQLDRIYSEMEKMEKTDKKHYVQDRIARDLKDMIDEVGKPVKKP
jgi:RHS repeat-associated protein